MSTISYSNVQTIEKEKQYLSRRLDKYAKFYWRGEDMWETYSTFIENNGSALKFVNGPSFSNEYSSPQYDHAMGNLTGVKFSRMQLNFTICTYGVTAAEYRSLIAALGPYEIDYLAFAYDDKLCYLAKTTGMKEAVKNVIGTNNNGEDLYLVENNITFEVQGEQCALAQRQYVWTFREQAPIGGYYKTSLPNPLPSELLPSSEVPFGITSELTFLCNTTGDSSIVRLYIGLGDDVNFIVGEGSERIENADLLCEIIFNPLSTNWMNTQNQNTLEQIDRELSIKYDSVSGLIFLQYGDSDYKVLDLLLTNTYGSLIVNDITSTKMKIDKKQPVQDIVLVWELINCDLATNTDTPLTYKKITSYGRAKTILM